MPRYICIRDCHFINRYWSKDDVFDFPQFLVDKIPDHFELLKGEMPVDKNGRVIPPVEPPPPSTMHELNEELKKRSHPSSGMGWTPPAKPATPEEAAAFSKAQADEAVSVRPAAPVGGVVEEMPAGSIVDPGMGQQPKVTEPWRPPKGEAKPKPK